MQEESRTQPESRLRCDFLLSWVFLASLATLLVNDFYLKPYQPSALSGVLSDLAGFIFFPILLVAAAELATLVTPSKRLATPPWFAVASGLVCVCFVCAKFTDWGEGIYVALVTPLVSITGSWLGLNTYGVVRDPWDLLALLLIPVPWLIGRHWRGGKAVARAT